MATNIKIIGLPKVICFDLIDTDPDQPRQVFPEEEARELEKSLKKNGIHNPNIYVRPNPKKEGHYIIVAGERRFRALRNAGEKEFEFRVVDKGTSPYKISIIENKCRLDLNPMDEAEGYAKWMKQDGLTVAQIAEEIPENPQNIYRSLRLLKLPEKVKELIRQGKLKTGAAHHLVQYGKMGIAKQVELAQRLIAGEDPPEIDEQLTTRSDHGETIILGRLPTTADGLIRRLLKFRQRSNPVPFVIKAFLDLPEAKQVEGWQNFTKLTRENFTTQLQALIFNLQLLQKKMAELPETKKNPFGPAASKKKAPAGEEKAVSGKKEEKPASKDTFFEEYLMQAHSPEKSESPPGKPEVSEESHIAASKSVSESSAADAKPPKPEPIPEMPKRDPAPTKVPVFLNKTAVNAAPKSALPQRHPDRTSEPDGEVRFKPKGIPTAAELEAASKVIVFLYEEITEGRRKLLSKKTLSAVLSNGKLPENAEALAIKALRTIRDYWRVPPDPLHPETQRFIVLVSQKRHDLERMGCARFDDLMTVIKNRDNSSDPINVQRL